MSLPFVTVRLGAYVPATTSYAACVLVGLWLGAQTLSRIRSVRALEGHVATSGAPGPRRVTGRARREEDVFSPLGQRGIGWAGAVWYWKRGKQATHEEICGRGDLSLLVENGARIERLSFVRPGESLTTWPEASSAGGPRVHLGPPRGNGSIPPGIAAACAREIAEAGDVELQYAEAVLTENQRIDGFACADSTATLQPCNDGFDLLTIGSADLDIERARHDRTLFAIVAIAWNGLVLFAAAKELGRRVVRGRGAHGREPLAELGGDGSVEGRASVRHDSGDATCDAAIGPEVTRRRRL